MADGSRTSPEERVHPAWARYAMPSAADLIFITLLVLLVFTPLSVRLLGDAGIGWHIRAGQQILAMHSIPRLDRFSSTMNGKPWFAWEWLYDVLVGGLERAAGLNGVVLFTALIIAGVFAWAFRLLMTRGTSLPLAVVLLLLAASASMIHFFARPHVLSWLLTLACFAVLDSTERCSLDPRSHERGWLLWLLPPLMLVWVNVHGGFVVGFVLIAIFLISATWQWHRAGEGKFDEFLLRLGAAKRARDLTLVGVVAAAATLANPYGFKLHVHVYRYLSNRFLMDHIDEFQSPNFHGVAQKCFAGLLLITLIALAARVRELRLSETLVVLFAAYSGLYASRNIPVASLLLILAAGPILTRAIERIISADFSARMERIESALQGHLSPVAAIVLACWIAANGGKLGATPLMTAHFDAKRFPVAAVDYLEGHQTTGPVLSPDYWGGYLIYRRAPKALVVADDRHDLYGENFFKSYLKMVHVEPGWDELLLRYNVNCLVVPKDSPLANMLGEAPGWKAIYADDVAIIFSRR